MENWFIILGLLVCCPIFTAAIYPFDPDNINNIFENNAKENNNSVNSTSTWYCPDGWVPYISDSEILCLWLEKLAMGFSTAMQRCQSSEGSLVIFEDPKKEQFVKSLVRTEEISEGWVGLSKDRGYDAVFQWTTKNGRFPVKDEILPARNYPTYKAQCGYIYNFENLEVDDCETEYPSVCEKKIACRPGTFGKKCEKECHCVGESCDSKSADEPEGVTCKWGCQKNWMGSACDTKKIDPEVKYFCINPPKRDERYVYIRIYTHGVQYRAIYGLDVNNTRTDWCDSTFIDANEDPYTLTTITIPLTYSSIAQMNADKCVGVQVNEDTFSWNILIKENEGILLEHDLIVNITCDFSTAETLVRAAQYSLNGVPHIEHKEVSSPESTEDDVSLQVIDAYSGQPVQETSIGSTVVLQMKFGLKTGSLLKNVFPYNCQAVSADEKHVKLLLDDHGCQAPNSPLQPFAQKGNNRLVTPWLSIFGFEDEQIITFRCSFYLCFASDCKTGCQRKSRFRREEEDETVDEQHTTTRTIRVLPSISPKKGTSVKLSNPEYDTGKAQTQVGYEFGHFVYVNPVTCILFLLILLIFIGMFIAFLVTLRKAVSDIRKEIEVKRSRDKFLHCGCVQQKDRDFISP